MDFTVFRRRGKGALGQILFLAVLALVFGCDRHPAGTKAAGAEQAVVTSGDVVGSDSSTEPARIVSLAPNVTEILFELGAGQRIVGVTRFCDYPAEAKDIPKIGGIVDTDFEAIIARRPDLVVGTSSGADPKIARQLDEADIAYGFVRMDNLEQTYRGIEKIGDFIGAADRGRALAAKMKARVDEVARASQPASKQAERPRVLMVFGRNPLVAAGPKTFGHELVELAGGDNVMGDAQTSYPKLDIEKVISLNPERIIDATMAGEELDAEFWTEYDSIDAVQGGHVYLIADPVVLRPAPRLVEGLGIIRKAVEGDQQ
jgi:iron complex transport system substrate-binding protein